MANEEPQRDRPPSDAPSASARLGGQQTPDDYDAIMRANRRRFALIGLATGGVMALIVLLCVFLLVMLSSQ